MSFSYYRARDTQDALAVAASHPNAMFIAGGTDLMQLYKARVSAPGLVIDITRLGMAAIESRDGAHIAIGALARLSDIAEHPLIRAECPALTEALAASASPQVRHMATLGGNLLQRTRCAYFRDATLPCNKRQPGAGCGALDGENRLHALFGTSTQCVATHASDAAVALSASGARVRLLGREGERVVAIDDFFVPPGLEPARETVLAPGELIVAVEIPRTAWAKQSRYLKVRDRASFEFAIVSVAAGVLIEDGVIRVARITAGGVGTTPWRLYQCEAKLIDMPASAAAVSAAADSAGDGARPLRANGFKVELLRRAVLRVLRDLTGVSQGEAA